MTCPPAQTIQGVQDIIYAVLNSGKNPEAEIRPGEEEPASTIDLEVLV